MPPLRNLVAAGLVLGVAACAGNQVPPAAPADVAVREDVVETTATVQAVNTDRREVMIRTEDGRFLTVEAGPQVRNFDQIEVGDTIRTSYVESVVVAMAPTGEEDMPSETVVAAVRAPAGTRPGVAVAEETTTTVTFLSYDPETAIAVFTTPEGTTHSIVVSPPMRDFASRRQPGDRIDVAYTTAVAIAVEETEN